MRWRKPSVESLSIVREQGLRRGHLWNERADSMSASLWSWCRGESLELGEGRSRKTLGRQGPRTADPGGFLLYSTEKQKARTDTTVELMQKVREWESSRNFAYMSRRKFKKKILKPQWKGAVKPVRSGVWEAFAGPSTSEESRPRLWRQTWYIPSWRH